MPKGKKQVVKEFQPAVHWPKMKVGVECYLGITQAVQIDVVNDLTVELAQGEACKSKTGNRAEDFLIPFFNTHKPPNKQFVLVLRRNDAPLRLEFQLLYSSNPRFPTTPRLGSGRNVAAHIPQIENTTADGRRISFGIHLISVLHL